MSRMVEKLASSGKKLASFITKAGPIFIKAGQLFAQAGQLFSHSENTCLDQTFWGINPSAHLQCLNI